MNTHAFQEQLRNVGSYSSPGSPRGWQPPPWLATPLFGLFMAEIFVRGNIHSRRPSFMEREWAAFGLRVLHLVERLRGRVAIEGFEQVRDAKRPVVWVANHVSSLETYLLPPILMSWPGLIIVLKEALAHYPLFGSVVRAVDPIRVLRQNPIEDLRKVLNEGVAGIAAGRSALIFPQGARYREFDPATFNTLGTKLAIKAGVPLVPIAVSTDFIRIGKLHRDATASIHPSSPVRIACGAPIPCDLGQAEMQRQSIAFIVSKLTQWEQEDGLSLIRKAPTPS